MCESTTGIRDRVEVEIGRTVSLPFGEASRMIEQALQREGFGVLTRIDVKETLEKKLGVTLAPYLILGACNPQLARRALELEPRMGVLLPCNIVVRELAPGKTRVEAVNPEAMADLFPGTELESVAHEARRGLLRALDTIGAPVAT